MNLIQFHSLGDDRGSLVSLESNNEIPFDIKRVYFISKIPTGISRGFHAHKKLKQVAVCISGSCRFVLDNGSSQHEVLLNSPLEGLLIEGMIWREMYDFSQDCVLMVIASEYYDEADYIRDYDKFICEVNRK